MDKFQKDIKTIAWSGLGIFLSLSLFSFSPDDPSFTSTGKGGAVHNLCGYVGSFLADFLYQVTGVTAWALVFTCFYFAWKNFSGKRPGQNILKVGLSGVFLTTLACLISLYFPEEKIFGNSIYYGGVLGLFITKAMVSVLNFTGVAVVLWSALLVLFLIYTEKTMKEIYEDFTGAIALIPSPSQSLHCCYDFLVWAQNSFFGHEELAIEYGARRRIEETDFVEEDEIEDDFQKHLECDIENEVVVAAASKPTKTRFFLKSPKASKKKKAKRKRIIENWELPKLGLLEDPPSTRLKVDEKSIKRDTHLLENKLSQFSVNGKVTAVRPGPAVTMFEFKPNADVKISKITDLADDLSLAMSSESVRIIAPLPGRDVVGIETSNQRRDTVFLKEILEDEEFWEEDIKLPLALGKQANGLSKVVDLRKMPHLLVAGTTGSGKSVFINSILSGLLFRHSPKTLKLILVDPKQVDLASFHKVPHLIMPPIKEPKKAVVSLKWAVKEMEKRYRSMSRFNVRGIEGFNDKVSQFSDKQIAEHQAYNEELENTQRATTEAYYFTPQPYIVVVVEEFGDLMAVDKANVEQLIVRLAQMARASGMHLVLAMQSPRRDVVTGLIKTNIPGRISFKVASKTDSRIILDDSGAERLLARGDMLFLAPGVSKPERHHGAYVSDEEMSDVTEFWSEQGEPDYDAGAMSVLNGTGGGYNLDGGSFAEEEEVDERYDEVLAYISGMKEVSASLLQRKFRLGYPRAARMIEIFEREGVVGPPNGSKPRQVLVSKL